MEQHLKDKERLEHSLPSSIVIGPFIVRVEAVRQALSNKRKALANAMLNHLVRKLRKQVDDVSHSFRGQKALNYTVHTVWVLCIYVIYKCLSVLIFFFTQDLYLLQPDHFLLF